MRIIPQLDRARAVLLLVDYQERLVPAMHNAERIIGNAIRLARGAAVLGIPRLVTEQYPRGLGPTVPALVEALGEIPRFQKTSFSALGAARLRDHFAATTQVLLAGIESHVCVCQTALELIAAGHTVFVAEDAVSSRTPENDRAGIARMRAEGAVIVSTEMALFECLRDAGLPEFKAVQALVK